MFFEDFIIEMRGKVKYSNNHWGQLCYHCGKPIYGEGLLADIIGKPGQGCTSYHLDCYETKTQRLVPPPLPITYCRWCREEVAIYPNGTCSQCGGLHE